MSGKALLMNKKVCWVCGLEKRGCRRIGTHFHEHTCERKGVVDTSCLACTNPEPIEEWVCGQCYRDYGLDGR